MRTFLLHGLLFLVAILAPCTVVGQPYETVTNEMGWAPSPHTEEYVIQRSTDGGPYVQVAVIPASQTSYQDVNLPVGPVYAWRIVARNSAGVSVPSSTCATHTTPPPAPGIVTCTVTFNPKAPSP